MTIKTPSTGVDVNPKDIIDANQLNNRFFEVREGLRLDGLLGRGWMSYDSAFPFDPPVYHSANSIKIDLDLVTDRTLEPGMKVTLEQPTNGEYFGFITKVDYSTTVSGETYIEIYFYNQEDLVDEAIVGGSLGFSREALPEGFPNRGDDGWVTEIDFGSTGKTGAGWSATGTTFDLPVGTYEIYIQGLFFVERNVTRARGAFALSTDGTESNIIDKSEFYLSVDKGTNIRNTLRVHFDYTFSTPTTLTIMLYGQDGDTETNIFSFRRRFLSYRPAYN